MSKLIEIKYSKINKVRLLHNVIKKSLSIFKTNNVFMTQSLFVKNNFIFCHLRQYNSFHQLLHNSKKSVGPWQTWVDEIKIPRKHKQNHH